MHGQWFSDHVLKLRADGVDQLMNFFCGSYGSHRIILMNLWHPEERHHCITNKFLNSPIIFAHRGGNLPKDLIHDLFDFFGIQPLRHGRISGEIGKKNRHLFSFLFNGGFNFSSWGSIQLGARTCRRT